MVAAIPTSHSFPIGPYDDSKESIYTQLNFDTTENINLDIINYETKLAKKLFKISQMEIPGEGKLDFKYKHRKLVYTGEDRKFRDQCAELYVRCLENEKIRHYLERENIQLDDFIFNHQEIKEGLKAKRQAINEKYGKHGFKVNVETGDWEQYSDASNSDKNLRKDKYGWFLPGKRKNKGPTNEELKDAGLDRPKKKSKTKTAIIGTMLAMTAFGAGWGLYNLLKWHGPSDEIVTQTNLIKYKYNDSGNISYATFSDLYFDHDPARCGWNYQFNIKVRGEIIKTDCGGHFVKIIEKDPFFVRNESNINDIYLKTYIMLRDGFSKTDEWKKIMDIHNTTPGPDQVKFYKIKYINGEGGNLLDTLIEASIKNESEIGVKYKDLLQASEPSVSDKKEAAPRRIE